MTFADTKPIYDAGVWVKLTFSWAQSPGSGDHGEGGASMYGAQVVLHVGADVRMWWAERRLTRPGCRVG